MRLREDQFRIGVTVDGLPNGVLPTSNGGKGWMTLTGGEMEAEDVFLRPGGMADGVNLGGPVKRSDVTVTRPYDDSYHARIVELENSAGRATMSVTYQPLDADGILISTPVTMKGYLKTVQHSNIESATAAAGMLTLVMAADVRAAQ